MPRGPHEPAWLRSCSLYVKALKHPVLTIAALARILLLTGTATKARI